MTFAEASTIGLGSMTALMGLHRDLKIPPPFQGGITPQTLPTSSDMILIWGGSSSVGAYAIQFARLAGFKNIFATCSPRNCEYVKSLGATRVFDRNDPDVGKKIHEASGGKLKLIFDAVGGGDVLLEALGTEGGTIAVTLEQEAPKKCPPNVKVSNIFGMAIYKVTKFSHFPKKSNFLISQIFSFAVGSSLC